MPKKISWILRMSTASFAAFATPAHAQSEDEECGGAYIGGSFGLGAQSNDRNETVVFDTNRDGNFDNNVNTVLGRTPLHLDFAAARRQE
jgi:outer membrane immunogenic protein